MIFVLWSNTVLARHATEVMADYQFQGTRTRFVIDTVIANRPFVFMRGNTGHVRDPKYGEAMWVGS